MHQDRSIKTAAVYSIPNMAYAKLKKANIPRAEKKKQHEDDASDTKLNKPP